MARKPRKQNKEVTKKKINEPYNPGDFLYYLDVYNKPLLAEVTKAFTENGQQCYEVVDQTSYKFVTVPDKYCHDDPKFFKKKKRSDL